VRKYIGLDKLVEMVLERIGNVNRVFIVGDYAKGIDSGILEVVLEGVDLNEKYITQLTPKIEAELQKKVLISLTVVHDGSGLLVFEQEL
jgi:hypothetical protein